MNPIQKEIIRKGYEIMKQSNLTICAIARDCNQGLINNIPVLEKFRYNFKASNVIVFENDSVDGTKQTLKQWSNDYPNVNIISSDFNTITIPNDSLDGVNKYHSFFRITKMAEYRNNYLRVLNESDFLADYVIIIDLDISELSIDGVAHSFGLADRWDVVCANGYWRSTSLRKRYFDTYALVELGRENETQTENTIYWDHFVWSFLRPGLPLIPVYSAFGGMAIYKFEVLKNISYSVIMNNDKRVEVKCEHFSLCDSIRKAGFSRIFINPNMTLNNHRITWKGIIGLIKRTLKRE